jgi:hypothetical protein
MIKHGESTGDRKPMLDRIQDNLRHNLDRVESLVSTYESHPDAQGAGRKSVTVLDILRAAVVLLHASLEDVLRSVARWRLPAAPAPVLNEIPLVGHGPNPKKFLLGDLAAYRGRTVDDLFEESVRAHLEHSNYNNTGEVSALLTSVGIDPASVCATFPELQALMERRHQIVHRADRQETVSGSGDHEVRGINKQTVREWAAAVNRFASELFAQL